MPNFCNIQTPVLSGTGVLTGGLALLAFVMALYTLAAREQKTPYIANSVYSTALIVLTAIVLSTLGQLLDTTNKCLADLLTMLGTVLLGCGLILVFIRVRQAQNRRLNFRDDHLVKNIKVIQWLKNVRRSRKRQPTYEHNPVGLHEPLLTSIMQCLPPTTQLEAGIARNQDGDGLALSMSIACRVSTFTKADQLLVDVAICFLEQGYWVQYTTCTRHPIEFILQLKKGWQSKKKSKDWKQVADHIVAVDAYSPHYGFTDSIHNEMTQRLVGLGIECITAKSSYAGVHTAAAKAFNKIKGRSKALSGQEIRKPTLVIYDGPHALVELESSEQYRIFIRHLIPSERLWGGMLTLVVESVISEPDLALLRAYADVFIDLTDTDDRPQTSSHDVGRQIGQPLPIDSGSAAGGRP